MYAVHAFTVNRIRELFGAQARRSEFMVTTAKESPLLVPEILLLIFQHFILPTSGSGSSADLAQSARVCRAWQGPAEASIYSSISIKWHLPMAPLFLRTLTSRPDLAESVQHLTIYGDYARSTLLRDIQLRLRRTGEITKTQQEFCSRYVGRELPEGELGVNFHWKESADFRDMLDEEVERIASVLCSDYHWDYNFRTDGIFRSIMNRLTNLKSLSMDQFNFFKDGYALKLPDFWNTVTSINLHHVSESTMYPLLRRFPQLRSIRLRPINDDPWNRQESLFSDVPLAFPHLEELVITDYRSITTIEETLYNSQETLQILSFLGTGVGEAEYFLRFLPPFPQLSHFTLNHLHSVLAINTPDHLEFAPNLTHLTTSTQVFRSELLFLPTSLISIQTFINLDTVDDEFPVYPSPLEVLPEVLEHTKKLEKLKQLRIAFRPGNKCDEEVVEDFERQMKWRGVEAKVVFELGGIVDEGNVFRRK